MVESSVKDNNYSVNSIDSSVNLIDQVKTIPKEELYDYAINYLTTHTYTNGKNIAINYLYEVYNQTYTRPDYNKIRKYLTYRFGRVIRLLNIEGKLMGYTSKLYKRVELTKPVIDTTKSHLVFSQGKFKNPKYYDIKE